MKKILAILVFFLFSIGIVNAKACEVVSGSGVNIGDEVKCGTEYFYIISNDNEVVRMLSKYNLYVGRIYDKVSFGQTFSSYSEARTYWKDTLSSQYDGYTSFLANDNSEYYGVLAYKFLEYDSVLQNKDAIGAHGGVTGEPEFPEVGIVSSIYINSDYIDNYQGDIRFIDFDLSESEEGEDTLNYYLNEYLNSLNEMDVNVTSTSILSLTELNDLVYNINGKRLPLEDWYEEKDKEYNDSYSSYVYVLGSIKDELPKGYEWIYSTTYWLRTLSNDDGNISQYFVDTLGDLCTGDYCFYSIGAGIRPVVAINSDELIYKVDTKTDGNGVIKPNKYEALFNEEVSFEILPNNGYVLDSLKVVDGKNRDIKVDSNKFIMPKSNVLIEATFKIKNPETNTFLGIFIFSLFGISGIVIYLNRKKIFKR